WQLPGAAWQKSSYSNPSGNCVEMARLPAGQVAVRDSKRPGDPVLVFTRAEWSAFVTALRTAHVCLPVPAPALGRARRPSLTCRMVVSDRGTAAWAGPAGASFARHTRYPPKRSCNRNVSGIRLWSFNAARGRLPWSGFDGEGAWSE